MSNRIKIDVFTSLETSLYRGRSIQTSTHKSSGIYYLQNNINAINTWTTNITNKVGPFNPQLILPISLQTFIKYTTWDLRLLDMDISPYHIGGNGSSFTPGQSGKKMDEMTKLFGRIQLRTPSKSLGKRNLRLCATQEAMESFAFPDKIDRSWKLMNIFWPLKILQKRSKLNIFHWKYQENTFFHFDCYPEGIASIRKSST